MLILEININHSQGRGITIYKKEPSGRFRYYFEYYGQGLCTCILCRPNTFGGIELSTTKIK